MDYHTDLRIKKTEMDFLFKLLTDGSSLEDANKLHCTNYGTDEDIFVKRAYFEDGSYTDLSVFTGTECIMSSIYLYVGDNDAFTECDEGFEGDWEFKRNGNTYTVHISAIENEFINTDGFSDVQNNGVQEYFNIKCDNNSIDVMRNISTDYSAHLKVAGSIVPVRHQLEVV